MTNFWTSDTHFGHERICELSRRPFADVDEMNEALIENWNSVVTNDDTIFHLGDAALGSWVKWDSIFKRLNGHKVLVVGNHDRVFKGMKDSQQKKFEPLYADWFHRVETHIGGFFLDNGTLVNMSHFPYDGDSHEGDRHAEHRLPDRGRVLIHGHTHREVLEDTESGRREARLSRSKRGTLQVHVGVDSWSYRPVSEDEIIELIESAK